MNKAILIVDPQRDFIDGTLPVPGAAGAMNNLANYIAKNNGLYALKIITGDNHPSTHCSFRENGGQWPRHCVVGTNGAEIWHPLAEALNATQGENVFLAKGEKSHQEEYSIFAPHEANIAALLAKYHIGSLDICGIAGDVCVLNTLKDALASPAIGSLTVLESFCPSLDGGKKLREFCKGENVSCSRL